MTLVLMLIVHLRGNERHGRKTKVIVIGQKSADAVQSLTPVAESNTTAGLTPSLCLCAGFEEVPVQTVAEVSVEGGAAAQPGDVTLLEDKMVPLVSYYSRCLLPSVWRVFTPSW